MALQIIIGGSGSGKSSYMYEKLINNTGKGMAIVPEQFTMETQKNIVCASKNGGTMDIDILSFQRLAKRILDESGIVLPGILDETGKCLILRKVIEENKDELPMFGSKVKLTGFIDEIKSIISEMYQYGIDEKKIDDIIDKTINKPLLNAKFKDIKIIEEKFRKYLEDKYIVNEELLSRVCKYIPDSKIVKESTIVFDEYTGFSPVQFEIIRYLLKYSVDVKFAFNIREAHKRDYSKENDIDIFNLSVKTINKLKKIAKEENVEILEDVILENNNRLINNEMCGFLEKNIFKYGKNVSNLDGDSISIHVCDNAVAEADFVAYNIEKLVRENGYRYKDIAVVTADLEEYHNEISESFYKYDIPYFMDYKRSIISNPMVESLRAILEIITDNYSYESVFRYLRCGMSNLNRYEIDLLENYAISHGLSSAKRWNTEIINDREDYENARKKLIEETGDIYKFMKKRGGVPAGEAVAEIKNFINLLDMENKLSQHAEKLLAKDEIARSKEFSRTYDLVIELLDKICELAKDEIVDARSLSAMLDSGFEEIKVSIVPPTIDSVVVGDIERTRLNNIKVMFLIGVNDGVIPKSGSSTGLLTQLERDYLSGYGVELAPSPKENVIIQKFYIYMILSKMSDKLYISYKRTGGDGKSKSPSYLVNNIIKMFKNIKIVDEGKNEEMKNDILNLKIAKDFVGRNMHNFIKGEIDDEKKIKFLEAFVVCKKNGVNTDAMIKSAINRMEKSELDRAVAHAIYGDDFVNSVSRLELFAKCAYRHFISYGLNLMERSEYTIEKKDLGSIYHSAIELYFKKIRDRKIKYENIDDDLRKALINECVNESVEINQGNVFFENGRNLYMLERVKKVSDKTAHILTEQIKGGEFIPTMFERKFSTEYGLDHLNFNYDNGVRMGLKGVIDRIDYCYSGDNVYVKIIDYKSGKKEFDIRDVYDGLQLQLVLYMDAALEITKDKYPDKNVIPAGIFYYKIDDPIIDSDDIKIKSDNEAMAEEYREKVNEMNLLQLRPDGVFIDNVDVIRALDKEIEEKEFSGGVSNYIPLKLKKGGDISATGSKNINRVSMDSMINYVHNKIGSLGEKMVLGDISVKPFARDEEILGCQYCNYKDICGFDEKKPGCSVNSTKKMDKSDIWVEIRKKGGNKDGE